MSCVWAYSQFKRYIRNESDFCQISAAGAYFFSLGGVLYVFINKCYLWVNTTFLFLFIMVIVKEDFSV